MDRRKMHLDEGDFMAAITDYLNKKSLDRLVPDWETLDLTVGVGNKYPLYMSMRIECYMPDRVKDSSSEVLVGG